jgi:hypothetical protein
MHTEFYSENLNRLDHLGNVGVDVDSIKMDFKEIWFEGMNWIHLTE